MDALEIAAVITIKCSAGCIPFLPSCGIARSISVLVFIPPTNHVLVGVAVRESRALYWRIRRLGAMVL
jgi:hypothetical protein